MKVLSNLISSLWILALLTMLGVALPVAASGITGLCYDSPEHTRASVAYDGTRSPVFDYDSASTLYATKSDKQIGEAGHVLARFAGFLAAKSGGQGFSSFSSFKRALGPADENAQWHHIVEKTPGNLERFGAQTIHNTENLVPVPAGIHRQISGFYSSKQPFTGGQTVSQWLSTQPLEAQQQFGRQVMEQLEAQLP
jgi:hypothetical protein